MTERPRAGGDALTGATGDLTPDELGRPLVTGEAREVADPSVRAAVTLNQGLRAPSQTGETGDPTPLPEGGPTNLATRDEGYGSEHGLNPDDPAYRMEIHDPSRPATRPAAPRETVQGGDDLSDRPEHF